MAIEFLIAGAQKAGTTALHAVLSRHPRIFMPERKELHFFDDDRQDWSRPDYAAYEAHFRGSGPSQLRGEATPAYMFWPGSMERIAAYNPRVRLILILRNPIERAYSCWAMQRSRGRERLSFSDAIRSGRERVREGDERDVRWFSYVERGMYAHQLRRIFACFPKDQVLVLLHDEMRRQPERFLSRVATFLAIDPIDPTLLEQNFSPYVKGVALDPLRDDDAAYLKSVFRQDVLDLRRLIEADLESWGIA